MTTEPIPREPILRPTAQVAKHPIHPALDKSGALLVADDVGNTVWRVTSSNQPQVTQR